jgi:hypothetical protein
MIAALPVCLRHLMAYPWPRPGDPGIPHPHWLARELEWPRRDAVARLLMLAIWVVLLLLGATLLVAAGLPRGHYASYLRPGTPTRPAPTVARVVPRAGGLRAAPVVTRGGAPTRPARGSDGSPPSAPGRAQHPPGAAVLPNQTAAAPGHHNSQGARFGTLRAPWGSVPNVP